uniref:Phorbol-ester/DAG-type domain-containing protein n=1 Tax=Macrostomum lignano TaxID=282301 RepID=A0A1I8FHJ0_9PLAT
AMLVFLHCLLARGAESGQTGSSLWPVHHRHHPSPSPSPSPSHHRHHHHHHHHHITVTITVTITITVTYTITITIIVTITITSPSPSPSPSPSHHHHHHHHHHHITVTITHHHHHHITVTITSPSPSHHRHHHHHHHHHVTVTITITITITPSHHRHHHHHYHYHHHHHRHHHHHDHCHGHRELDFQYFDWLAEDWSGATGCTKPKHSRRYAYEIYSTFLHEESPLSLLASNSDTDASRQQLHDEAVHPLERLFGIGASTGADPASTVRQAQPLINRAQALMAPTLARLATGALADLQQKRRDGFLSDLLPALPGGSTPEQRRLFAARCRPGLLARLRMLRQSQSARQLPLRPPAWPPCCVRGLDPELAESLAPESRRCCSAASTEAQKSLLSRMGRAAASAASASSGSGAAPDERLRVGAHALEPCALTKAQVCAACDQVLYGAAPQGLQCTADCEQVVHRSCAQQLSSALCTKRAAARAKTPALAFRRQQQQAATAPSAAPFIAGVDASSDASTTICRWRIDEVEDWMLSGRQVQRNNPDCADDLPILKLTSSRSDQAVSQLAAETFRAARIAHQACIIGPTASLNP